MCEGSSGSISQTVCTPVATLGTTTTPAFAPPSKSELGTAIEACLDVSAKGDCSHNMHGAIGEWDVSRVIDMSSMLAISSFNGNISRWDVSKVIDMTGMFMTAISFAQW